MSAIPSSHKPHMRSAPAAGTPPVLSTTRYDSVSSILLAVVAGLLLCVALLGVAWYASRIPKPPEPIPVELVEIAGGVEDGAPDESLRVDSPAPENEEASITSEPADVAEMQETLSSVVELSDEAIDLAQRLTEEDAQNTGVAGSAHGTGRRALGKGPGKQGFPREQRWFVRYADGQTIDEYGRQLDFFGIELGAIVAGKLAYASQFSQPRPHVRTVDSGTGETRLYMTWQGGSRRTADLQLLKKAGIDVGGGTVFQFYPPAIEQQLAVLERDYRNRSADEIRRTFFAVRAGEQGGYVFYVTRQTYLR